MDREILIQKSEEKIKQILSALDGKKFTNELSLMTGTSGSVLFYFYLARMRSCDKLYDQAFEILTSVIDKIEVRGVATYTYCDGLTGFGVLFHHLIKNGFLDANEDDILSSVDSIIVQSTLYNISMNDFDFLHGGIGNAFYLLARKQVKENRECLNKLIEQLYTTAVQDNEGIRWYDIPSIIDNPKESLNNLSLSHGLCSRIIFFSRCIDNNFQKKVCKELLIGSVKYLLSLRTENSSISRYPSKIVSGKKKKFVNRLAWCYGDLGVAIALLRAAKSIGKQAWLIEAIHTGQLASKLDKIETGVIDCEFCHGAAGVAHIFNRLFFETGIQSFRMASDKWIQHTLEMSTFENGPAGYKSWWGNEWSDNYSLLEGIMGIGLVLQTFINESNEFQSWDELFLLK